MRASGVVGLGCLWILSAACDPVEGPPTVAPIADSADQVWFGTVHNVTIEGIRRARIEADTAFYYDGTQTFEMRNLTVTFYDASGGESSRITSRAGTYEARDGNMEARDDVVAVTPTGRRLTTSVLRYEKVANRLIGDAPFVFDAPDRHLEGNAFTSDPDFTDIEVTGDISGRLRGRP